MNESEDTTPLDEITFDIDAVSGSGSSGQAFSARPMIERGLSEPVVVADEASPIFKLLAQPELPELRHEPRGRLMLQSPTRLYFYWSVGPHAYQALIKTLGGSVDDYRLALRLLNLTTETEELNAVEAEGNWWFEVQPDTDYRAEIGFYSSSRPFVRILFSNTISTPRKSPSPHSATEARWALTTHKFAEVLDASGFEEDAIEIIRETAHDDLKTSFAAHIGIDEGSLSGFEGNELARALAMLAGGTPIEDLKWKISAELFAVLQAHVGKLTTSAINESTGISAMLEETEFETFSAVGGSLVNFPRRKYKPVSSMSMR